LLSVLGLERLIASSADDYIRIATEVANDPPALAELRSTMRDRMRASPLMDAAGFTARLGDQYRAIWRRRLTT
jgi:predicted O-linked N-acetylglucosamine transferase (SPINDLY family)